MKELNFACLCFFHCPSWVVAVVRLAIFSISALHGWLLFCLWKSFLSPLLTGDCCSSVCRRWTGGRRMKWGLLLLWTPFSPLSTLLRSSSSPLSSPDEVRPKRSKVAQNGQSTCYRSFGTMLGPVGPFCTYSGKTWYFTQKHFGHPQLFRVSLVVDNGVIVSSLMSKNCAGKCLLQCNHNLDSEAY